MKENIVLETEQIIGIVNHAGAEALALFCVIESASGSQVVTVQWLAEQLNWSTGAVEQACYRLGLWALDIRQATKGKVKPLRDVQ